MPWTDADIPDLSTKTILITGANTGIGFHAALLCAKHGARVILACRNVDKMAAAASEIQKQVPDAQLVQMKLDVSDLEDVRAFADTFKTSGIAQLDVLILNAGVIMLKHEKSKQGFDKMFATNHLGHWLLTGLLLDYIKDVPDSRIIAVSSIGHKVPSAINYAITKGEDVESYVGIRGYCETKLANHWFVNVLQQKLAAANAQTVAVAAHPGGSKTELAREADQSWFLSIYVAVMSWFMQSAELGAWPLVYAATDADVKPGNYYGPSGFREMRGPVVSNGFRGAAVGDEEKARELWRVSEEMTGFSYSI